MADSSPRSLKFSRGMRIKQGRDFSRIRREGRRLAAGCVIANWQALPAGTAARLGVVTSSRIGNAVARNRARRLLREVFRLHQHDLSSPVDLVLIARPSIAQKGLVEVERDVLTTLNRSGLLKK